MLTHGEIYRLFGEIDRLPGIMEPRIGRWRVWPVAKMPLVWHLMEARDASGAKQNVSVWSKLKERLPRYCADVSVALAQYRRMQALPRGGAVGMLYLPRVHRLADGRTQDFILGDLLAGDGLAKPCLALEHPWPAGVPAQRSHGAAIDLSPYYSFAEQLAVVLMATSQLRRTAAELNEQFPDVELPLDPAERGRKMLLALALFEAKRRLFRRLAARLQLQALVVTYGPGRFAEIAAARELGLPVIELQHGVIGSHCPDYAWPQEYRAFKPDIPLPDRIAVFGHVFRDLILRSGFWRESEILPVGAAAMEAFRRSARPAQRSRGPLRLVFMTQITSRHAAVPFWTELAHSPAFRADGLRVAFKIHPEEQRDAGVYHDIAGSTPDRFEIIPDGSNPIDVMLGSDIVVSYTSMSLVEALGLGVPAISLCGGSTPGGFAASFDLESIVTVMPHVRSPQELLAVLRERAADEGKLAQWREEARARGNDFFADGFTATAKALINDALAIKAQRATLTVH